MVTVAVGSLNDLGICRIESQGMDDGYVEFPSSSIAPGSPNWANYVKGVLACFHGKLANKNITDSIQF